MINIDGKIWCVHPMHASRAREAVNSVQLGEITGKTKPMESILRALPAEALPMELRNGVAIVPITTVIVDWVSYYYTSHPVLQQIFRHLAEHKPQNGVVCLFDTPGGTAKGSAETIDALNALQDAGVKVTAQVKGGCYSAGYKLASQCREGIYTHRMDEVGSIGSKLMLHDYSEAYKQHGVRVVPITNPGAEFKTLGEPGLPITEADEEFMNEYVADVFAEFKRCVMDGRGLSEEQFTEVSNGKWWLPEDAQQLGLIDGVRTFDETLASVVPTSGIFSREENPMASDAKATEDKPDAKTEDKPVETPAGETKPEESKPETPAGETKPEESKPDAPAGETKPTEGATDWSDPLVWVERFGADNGAKWFREEGCDQATALERHAALLETKLAESTAATEQTNQLLRDVAGHLGELNPLNLETKNDEEAGSPGGKTLGEIRRAATAARATMATTTGD